MALVFYQVILKRIQGMCLTVVTKTKKKQFFESKLPLSSAPSCDPKMQNSFISTLKPQSFCEKRESPMGGIVVFEPENMCCLVSLKIFGMYMQ